MKFALVNGNKVEATKGANGECPCCGSDLIAKCGELKVHHWAHKGSRKCDKWWENETEWHRSWKNYFPVEWQEIVQFDENGEKHIADVKTESGWTLEFQHSFLKSEERQARNDFYSKLVWVVDGTRRPTDKKQFEKILNESNRLPTNIPIIKPHFPDECRLLKEWSIGGSLVFFDFSGMEREDNSMLWFLFPNATTEEAYLSPFSQKNFIELHNDNGFESLFNNTILPIDTELSKRSQV